MGLRKEVPYEENYIMLLNNLYENIPYFFINL